MANYESLVRTSTLSASGALIPRTEEAVLKDDFSGKSGEEVRMLFGERIELFWTLVKASAETKFSHDLMRDMYVSTELDEKPGLIEVPQVKTLYTGWFLMERDSAIRPVLRGTNFSGRHNLPIDKIPYFIHKTADAAHKMHMVFAATPYQPILKDDLGTVGFVDDSRDIPGVNSFSWLSDELFIRDGLEACTKFKNDIGFESRKDLRFNLEGLIERAKKGDWAKLINYHYGMLLRRDALEKTLIPVMWDYFGTPVVSLEGERVALLYTDPRDKSVHLGVQRFPSKNTDALVALYTKSISQKNKLPLLPGVMGLISYYLPKK